jgi:hypothetical protein
MADGVMLGKGKVKIKILPGSLRVITDLDNNGKGRAQQENAGSLPKQDSKVTAQDNHDVVAIKVG